MTIKDLICVSLDRTVDLDPFYRNCKQQKTEAFKLWRYLQSLSNNPVQVQHKGAFVLIPVDHTQKGWVERGELGINVFN